MPSTHLSLNFHVIFSTHNRAISLVEQPRAAVVAHHIRTLYPGVPDRKAGVPSKPGFGLLGWKAGVPSKPGFGLLGWKAGVPSKPGFGLLG